MRKCLFLDLDNTIVPEAVFDALFIYYKFSRSSEFFWEDILITFLNLKESSRELTFNRLKNQFKSINNSLDELVFSYQNFNYDEFNPSYIHIYQSFSIIDQLIMDFPSHEVWIATEGSYNRQKNKIRALSIKSKLSGYIILDPNISPFKQKVNCNLQDYFEDKIEGLVVGDNIVSDKFFAENNNLKFNFFENKLESINQLISDIKKI